MPLCNRNTFKSLGARESIRNHGEFATFKSRAPHKPHATKPWQTVTLWKWLLEWTWHLWQVLPYLPEFSHRLWENRFATWINSPASAARNMETEAMPQPLPRQMISSFRLPTTSFPRLATAPQALSSFLLLTSQDSIVASTFLKPWSYFELLLFLKPKDYK